MKFFMHHSFDSNIHFLKDNYCTLLFCHSSLELWERFLETFFVKLERNVKFPRISVSFFCCFFCLWMWRKKIELKSPKLHTQGPQAHARTPLGGMPVPPKTAKNRGILILRVHVSPHLRAEAWTQVAVALAPRGIRTK